MSKAEILERESARARPTALLTIAGIFLLIAALVVGSGGTSTAETESRLLAEFPDDSGTLLIAAIMQAVGMLCLIAPLYYLFKAAAARSDKVRPGLIGVTIAGPLFFAIAFLLRWVALDQASADFAGGGSGIPVGEFAEDLITEQTAFAASQGFQIGGLLGTVIAMVYTSLHAMRVGLLTRFWGSLGMALGVGIFLLGPLALVFYFVPVGLIIGGLWRGGRPPAWEAGEAVPWPAPGQQPAAPDDPDRPADPDEFAGTIEGSGTELDEGAADEPVAGDSPRKRKRRG